MVLEGGWGRAGAGDEVEEPRWFFFSSRRRHTRYWRDWSSDVCSSDLRLVADMRREQQASRVGQVEAPAVAGPRDHPHMPRSRLDAGVVEQRAERDAAPALRSEERRVGKECRFRWLPHHSKNKYSYTTI